jgi:hypothetical protein
VKSKKTLIRLHKWKVDQERRKLLLLQAEQSSLQEKKAKLEKSAIEEQAKAADMEYGALLYPSFAQSVILRRAQIDDSLSGVSEKMKGALQSTKSAFLELKKYEIVEDNRVQSEKLEERRSEQREQDEVASQRYTRQNKSSKY